MISRFYFCNVEIHLQSFATFGTDTLLVMGSYDILDHCELTIENGTKNQRSHC